MMLLKESWFMKTLILSVGINSLITQTKLFIPVSPSLSLFSCQRSSVTSLPDYSLMFCLNLGPKIMGTEAMSQYTHFPLSMERLTFHHRPSKCCLHEVQLPVSKSRERMRRRGLTCTPGSLRTLWRHWGVFPMSPKQV